jgi:hypothetical protein
VKGRQKNNIGDTLGSIIKKEKILRREKKNDDGSTVKHLEESNDGGKY